LKSLRIRSRESREFVAGPGSSREQRRQLQLQQLFGAVVGVYPVDPCVQGQD
jgi:hypothetical protein